MRQCARISLQRCRYFSSKYSETLLEKFIASAKRNNEMECEVIIEDMSFDIQSDTLNGTDTFGNSPLMLCSQRNWYECCQKLIDLNCEVNHQNVFGSSALMCGASHGFIESVNTLLACKRVEVDLLSRYGQTALMKAVQAGKLNTFTLLVTAGANVNIRNKQGRSALDIAIERNHVQLIEELRRLGCK
jgi:ankyrin repeat protein